MGIINYQTKFKNFKKKLKGKNREILTKILPPIFALIIKVLFYLVRWEIQVSPKVSDKIKQNQTFVVAFWHGELLLQPLICNRFLHCSQKKASVLISQHFDGDLISGTIKFFGIDSLRGSSSKGGIRVLLNAVKKMESREYVAITPDGPRGPYHNVADGIVFLAQKSRTPIVISRVIYQSAWEFKSWDRFKIPKPFSKVHCIIKEPLNIESLKLDEAKILIKAKMEED